MPKIPDSDPWALRLQFNSIKQPKPGHPQPLRALYAHPESERPAFAIGLHGQDPQVFSEETDIISVLPDTTALVEKQ
jgi:hypothetical protein